MENLPVFDDSFFNADVAQKVKPPGMFCNLIEFEYLGGEHLHLQRVFPSQNVAIALKAAGF